MDDEQLIELLGQIQDLAGVALDSLKGGGQPAPEKEPKPEGEPPPAA
jgi:hypothetical protein